MSKRLRKVGAGETAFAGDAFVNQRFAVGQQGYDLLADVGFDSSQPPEFGIKVLHQFALLCQGRQWKVEHAHLGRVGRGQVGGALTRRLEIVTARLGCGDIGEKTRQQLVRMSAHGKNMVLMQAGRNLSGPYRTAPEFVEVAPSVIRTSPA